MSNPFEIPRQDGGPAGGGAPGDFDIATAYSAGMAAMSRNFLPWFGIMLVGGLATMISVLMCLVPALIVVPAISWGSTLFYLQALDGEAEFQSLFDAFDKLGEVVPTMLGFMVLMVLVYLPGTIAGQVFSAVQFFTDDTMVVMLGSLMGTLIQTVWQVVIGARFVPAVYLVVEQKVGAVDALTQAWNMTANCWGKAIVFSISSFVLTLVGLIFCLVGVIPAAMLVSGASASVYRQLIGRA